MRKTLLFAGFVLGFCAWTYAQKLDCKHFHDGKFNNVSKGQILGVITRKGDKQIEQYGKEKITLCVKWLDDCTYELRCIKVNGAFKKAQPNADLSRVVQARIVKTEGAGYYLRAVDLGNEADSQSDMHFIFVK